MSPLGYNMVRPIFSCWHRIWCDAMATAASAPVWKAPIDEARRRDLEERMILEWMLLSLWP